MMSSVRVFQSIVLDLEFSDENWWTATWRYEDDPYPVGTKATYSVTSWFRWSAIWKAKRVLKSHVRDRVKQNRLKNRSERVNIEIDISELTGAS